MKSIFLKTKFNQNIEEQTVLTFDLPISNSKGQRDETKDFKS